ncbi:MAG: glycosyltransferase [Candidatus Omnitrophica bacterium]|nr:glycosyltransferase [Candidatus Omnitrophota bacterium]
MTRVLFIIWSLERGGAERFLAGLLNHIDRSRFEPVLCCMNWKGEWAEPLERKGIRVIELNKKKGIDLKAFWSLISIIREGKFQIVNTHLWLADVMGRIAAILCRVPVIISTAQNVDVWKKWHHRWIDRELATATVKIIAVSKAVKEYYENEVGIPGEKIEIIPNAIDVDLYKDVEDISYLYDEFDLKKENFILACIGRLDFQKGHKYLLESLKEIYNDMPDLRILIVGEGIEREDLKKSAEDYGIMPALRFTGQRQDIPHILKLSKALILPSIFEGLPLCVLEAMAASRPVIATNVGGTTELAVEGRTAFIVEPKRPDLLSSAIRRLRALPDQGRQMGINGYEIVARHYSIQSITDKTMNLFEQLVKVK